MLPTTFPEFGPERLECRELKLGNEAAYGEECDITPFSLHRG
jgi:hypothetical protein